MPVSVLLHSTPHDLSVSEYGFVLLNPRKSGQPPENPTISYVTPFLFHAGARCSAGDLNIFSYNFYFAISVASLLHENGETIRFAML